MKPRVSFPVLAALAITAPLVAEPQLTEAIKLETKFAADRAALTGAQVRRANLAAAIAGGSLTAERALGQLSADSAPAGLKVIPDAGFAFAAIDVGHRLLAVGKPTEAESFFRAAESALQRVIAATPDAMATDKAQYFSNLGFIRLRFLNKPVEAKADLESAERLTPDDKVVAGLRRDAGSRNREVFKSNAVQKE